MQIPDGITLSAKDGMLTAKGPKGSAHYPYDARKVKVDVNGSEVTVTSIGKKITRASTAMAKAVEAHIRNLFTGVTSGHSRKLSVVFSHFPVTVEINGKDVMFKNFMGEKESRKAHIVGDTNVQASKSDITINGPDIEDVGQTAANIINATRLTKRDRRIFQDGIYHAL